jgi:hypothetical protein
MKLTAPYKCDYCGTLKGETNHWWLRFQQADDSKPSRTPIGCSICTSTRSRGKRKPYAYYFRPMDGSDLLG